MKKKIFLLIPLFVLIISAVTPLTALAAVQPKGQTAYNVAKDYALTKGNDVVFKSGNDYFILCCPKTSTFGTVNSTLYAKASADFNYRIYKFDNDNVYKKPTETTLDYVLVQNGIKKIKSYSSLLYSTVNVYDITDTDGKLTLENSVFFKLGTETAETPEQTPGQTQNSSLSSSITSTLLSPVLSEVVAILPTLVPVLVTFIAIRKGLAFCLTTLRSC